MRNLLSLQLRAVCGLSSRRLITEQMIKPEGERLGNRLVIESHKRLIRSRKFDFQGLSIETKVNSLRAKEEKTKNTRTQKPPVQG